MTPDEIIDRVAEVAGVQLVGWQREVAQQLIELHASGGRLQYTVPRRNGRRTVEIWEAAYNRVLNEYRVSDYEVRNDN